MENFEALEVISRYRNDAIVVMTMTAHRDWPKITTNPDLDLPMSGCMGKASSVGLGLALAKPEKRVIVFDGDGSLLMNLGSLVTIANMAPPNLIHFVFYNSIYRITGGQPIPGVGKFSFKDIASAAGYANAYEFKDLKSLEDNIETIMKQRGPTFVCIQVAPNKEYPGPSIKTVDIIPRFKAALKG